MRRIGVAWLAAMAVARIVAANPDEGARKTTPTYTNADLDRVRGFRDQTGVTSRPAVSPSEEAPPASALDRKEQYWRRQAERLRDRLRPLQDQMDGLRGRIEERRRLPGVRPYTDSTVRGWERKIESLQDRARELESRLEERARREGALPGWLRP